MSKDPLDILPFAFLSRPDREALRGSLTERHYDIDDLLIAQGDPNDNQVFLLVSGSVQVNRSKPNSAKATTVIRSGHYFGDRTALFGGPRSNEVVALEPCVAWTMPGERLVALVAARPVIARAFADILRDKQGLFTAFDRFLAELKHGAGRGHIIIPRLLHLYKPLEPALHTKANEDALDFDALSYATRRLPANVSRTLSWFLVDELPTMYLRARELFEAVDCEGRRRAMWQVLPGKNLVVLRDNTSDLIDLVCCLCIYALEARKIRLRLSHPDILAQLRGPDSTQSVLRALPLSEKELAGLHRLWPDSLREQLVDIVLHHETFTVSILQSLNNYNRSHAEQWTRQVAKATKTLLGIAPADLADDFPIHIISSNTHSVTNCLSPWLRMHQGDILSWGRTHCTDICEQTWSDERDLMMALLRPYFDAHPKAASERTYFDAHSGSIHLEQTAFTGIAVQLFNADSLPQQAMPENCTPSRGMIINIDYAFGQQAEAIMAGLIKLFAGRIRSINVLGKAGGMQGKRGDIVVATGFVEQLDDSLYTPRCAVDIDELRARVPTRAVHIGRALTAVGTVLQNRTLLAYYMHIWGCVGLEMEGAWYCRRILEAQHLGILKEDVDLRFLYYVSDLPLEHGANLSQPMTLAEGVPPLYAATRSILKAIFQSTVSAKDTPR